MLDCARAEVANERQVGVQCYQPADLTGRCGRGELPFGDNCYLIGQERVTRLKAEIRCQQAGARLVEVTSQVSQQPHRSPQRRRVTAAARERPRPVTAPNPGNVFTPHLSGHSRHARQYLR